MSASVTARPAPQAGALGRSGSIFGDLTISRLPVGGSPAAGRSLAEGPSFRPMDKRTGQIDHLKYNPPPPDAELDSRADVRADSVERRLSESDATMAATPRYQGMSLSNEQVARAAGHKDVTEPLLAALG